MITKLDWDSSFFKTNVYSLEVECPEHVLDLKKLKGPCLVYVFMKNNDALLAKRVEQMGAIIYDRKVTYHKTLTADLHPSREFYVNKYNKGMNCELEELGIQAGGFSRFSKDPRLADHFEPFFREWVLNSVNGKIADCFFVSEDGNSINGFASCAIRNGQGRLGLLSVSAQVRGRGIGCSLLRATEGFYVEHDIFESFIVTQKDNMAACIFYESQGYKRISEIPTYHLWLD